MSESDLLKVINEAINTFKEYNAEKSSVIKKSHVDELLEVHKQSEIKKALQNLIKESYMLGPTGQLCPRCGGSGKV